MGQILRNQNWHIPIAILFAVVLIAGAYWLARSPSRVAEASEESALLQAIATKDTDGDGLSDWEEALYGTTPSIIDTFNLGMTDGEAVARGLIVPKAIADIPIATSTQQSLTADGLTPPAEGTLTAAFAKSFFTLFMTVKEANGGGDLTEKQMNDVASEALNSLASTVAVAPDYKSAKDITISGSGAEALLAFAISAEAVLKNNKSNATMSELNYLKNAIEKNDITAIPYISGIAKGYRDSAVGLSVLSVPRELVTDYLLLVNSMMRISQITSDFARVNDDPLATILALKQYPQAVINLGQAFTNIGAIYKSAGVTLSRDTPGASFVNLMMDIKP